jgi:hypothetical protein
MLLWSIDGVMLTAEIKSTQSKAYPVHHKSCVDWNVILNDDVGKGIMDYFKVLSHRWSY